MQNPRRQLHFTHGRPAICALYDVEHFVAMFLIMANSLKIIAV
jgi:hypothetical protein